MLSVPGYQNTSTGMWKCRTVLKNQPIIFKSDGLFLLFGCSRRLQINCWQVLWVLFEAHQDQILFTIIVSIYINVVG